MGNVQLARASASQNAAVVAMAKGFGRYGPMEEKTVRTAEVTGDELSYLRQRREMLRSMTPEQALQVIEFHDGLNVFEAVALAKKQGKIIVPNDVHDRILTEIDKDYTAWTGTSVIYEKPDTSFKDKVVYSWKHDDVQHSVTFNVPKQFRRKKNCALVVEYPDFEFASLGDNRFELKVAEGYVSLLEHFPKASDKWYEYDERFRIPIGNPGDKGKSRRCLWRRDGGYVGLVARGGGGWDGVRRYAGLDGGPSGALGVAVF